MKFNLTLQMLLIGLRAFVSAKKFDFRPESALASSTSLPYLYDVPEAQAVSTNLTTSYWTCSFVTASDGHQYMALGINMWQEGIPITGAITLDITDTTYFQSATSVVIDATKPSTDMRLNATIGNDTIYAISPDNFSQMGTYFKTGNVSFDLQFNSTSQILYTGGLGLFKLAGAISGEWSIPGARTTGTITARGETLSIDPNNSFTWYDRQWSIDGTGTPVSANYTWFQLIVPGTGIKASIWAIDEASGNQENRLATFRYADGSHRVLPFKFIPLAEDIFTPPGSETSFPTKYNLIFDGYGLISVSAIRKDQVVGSNYEGFATFGFNMFGIRKEGYGILEIVSV